MRANSHFVYLKKKIRAKEGIFDLTSCGIHLFFDNMKKKMF